MIHFDKKFCLGTPQDTPAIDSPSPRELACLELASKERVMDGMKYPVG